MNTTTPAPRLALLAIPTPRAAAAPVVRRYRLGRVLGDLGPALAGRPAPAQAAPRQGGRAP
ncbi:MAG TPA: hypothetical protein VM266_00870 [Solirubrobacteraceae bacterium]|nr:hypothetical protein [Solirubrobacteraceae bacterium]